MPRATRHGHAAHGRCLSAEDFEHEMGLDSDPEVSKYLGAEHARTSDESKELLLNR